MPLRRSARLKQAHGNDVPETLRDSSDGGKPRAGHMSTSERKRGRKSQDSSKEAKPDPSASSSTSSDRTQGQKRTKTAANSTGHSEIAGDKGAGKVKDEIAESVLVQSERTSQIQPRAPGVKASEEEQGEGELSRAAQVCVKTERGSQTSRKNGDAADQRRGELPQASTVFVKTETGTQTSEQASGRTEQRQIELPQAAGVRVKPERNGHVSSPPPELEQGGGARAIAASAAEGLTPALPRESPSGISVSRRMLDSRNRKAHRQRLREERAQLLAREDREQEAAREAREAWGPVEGPREPQAHFYGEGQALGPSPSASDCSILINRAPVLTLWVAVVARARGMSWATGYSLGRAVAGMFAYAKGKSLGIYEEKGDKDDKQRERKKKKEEGEEEEEKEEAEQEVRILGRKLWTVLGPRGVRLAVGHGGPIAPEPVENYLEKAFGDAPTLRSARDAMLDLACSYKDKDQLDREAYDLYCKFRPSIAAGKAGWGRKGLLNTHTIRALKKHTEG